MVSKELAGEPTVKLLNPNPLVMRPPNVPIPPEGQATALRVSQCKDLLPT
jgi:hypothetical protein